MEPVNVLKVFVKLEKDLAAFYRKLKNVSSIREIIETYEKMEQQSENHAEIILKDYQKYRIPDLDIEPLIVLHNHVKVKFLEEIKNESNILYVLQKLAEGEEQLGKIYKSIAAHYKKNSEKYEHLSKAIEKIAGEEFAHRDYILREMEKQQQKNLQETKTLESSTGEKGLSYQDYKKVQSTLSLMTNNLEDLNLRDNEKAIINCELNLIGQTLDASRDQIGNSFSKCQNILRKQKTNEKANHLMKELQKVRS